MSNTQETRLSAICDRELQRVGLAGNIAHGSPGGGGGKDSPLGWAKQYIQDAKNDGLSGWTRSGVRIWMERHSIPDKYEDMIVDLVRSRWN